MITITKSQPFDTSYFGEHGVLFRVRFNDACQRLGLQPRGGWLIHTLSNDGLVVDVPLIHLAERPGYVECKGPFQGPTVTITCQEACMVATNFALLWTWEQSESDDIGMLHEHLRPFLNQQENRSAIHALLD